MKIIYDKNEKVYAVMIEELENAFVFNTTDIVEAREQFIKQMMHLFNEAICKKLEHNWENSR